MLFLILLVLFVIGCFAAMIALTVMENNRRKKKTKKLIEYYAGQNRRRIIGEVKSTPDT